MKESNIAEILFRGGSATGVGAILCRILHGLTYAVLARFLTATAFGEIGLASIVVNALSLFPAFGLGTALLVEKREPYQLAPAALTLSGIGGLTLVVISVAILPFINRIYGGTVGYLVAVIGLTLGFRSVSTVASALLDREFRFRTRAIAEVAGGCAFLIVSVTLGFTGVGSAAIAWGLVAGAAVPTIIQIWAIKVRPIWSVSHFRELSSTARVGMVVLLTTIFNWLFLSALPLLLEARFSRDILGFYTLAFFLAMLPANCLGFLTGRLALPALVRARDQGIEAGKSFLRVTYLAAVLSSGATMVLLLLANHLILLLYGEAFVAGSGLLRILTLYSFARVLGGLAGPVLLATGNARISLFIVAAQNLVALPMAFFLPLSVGPEGLVLVFTIPVFLACIVALIIGAHLLRCQLYETIKVSLIPLALILAPGILFQLFFGFYGRLIGVLVGLFLTLFLSFRECVKLWPKNFALARSKV